MPAPPSPFKKTCPCTIFPRPPIFNFSGEVIKIYSLPPLKKGGGWVRTMLTCWVYISLKYGKTVKSCNYLIMGKQLKTSNIDDLKIKTIIYNKAHSLIIDLSNWFKILWLFLKFTWENFVNFFFSYFSQLFYCCCHHFSTKVTLIISFLELFLVTSILCIQQTQ